MSRPPFKLPSRTYPTMNSTRPMKRKGTSSLAIIKNINVLFNPRDLEKDPKKQRKHCQSIDLVMTICVNAILICQISKVEASISTEDIEINLQRMSHPKHHLEKKKKNS